MAADKNYHHKKCSLSEITFYKLLSGIDSRFPRILSIDDDTVCMQKYIADGYYLLHNILYLRDVEDYEVPISYFLSYPAEFREQLPRMFLSYTKYRDLQRQFINVPLEKLFGTFSRQYACKLLWQLLDAVRILHSMKIIHRDIKLENICFTENGDVVLVDFNSAYQFDITDDERTSPWILTACYTRPGARSRYGKFADDIWSVAMCLFILCSTHPCEVLNKEYGLGFCKGELIGEDGLVVFRDEIKLRLFELFKCNEEYDGIWNLIHEMMKASLCKWTREESMAEYFCNKSKKLYDTYIGMCSI